MISAQSAYVVLKKEMMSIGKNGDAEKILATARELLEKAYCTVQTTIQKALESLRASLALLLFASVLVLRQPRPDKRQPGQVAFGQSAAT